MDMKTAVIIHGYSDKSEYLDASRPSPSNDHWFPWLQRQLQMKGILAQTPDMPGFFEPNYLAWKEMLDKFTPDEETMLVGHSCGGGFLVRYLSENDVKVGKVVLVAPWLDPKKEIDPEFFNFEINPAITEKTAGLTIMYSKDDTPTILKTIETLKSKLVGAEFQEFEGKGHFCVGDIGSEFPELLNNLI